MNSASKEEKQMIENQMREMQIQEQYEMNQQPIIGIVDSCPILRAYNEKKNRSMSQKKVEINFSDVSNLDKHQLRHQDDEYIIQTSNNSNFDKILPDAPKTGTHLQKQGSFMKILSQQSRGSYSKEDNKIDNKSTTVPIQLQPTLYMQKQSTTDLLQQSEPKSISSPKRRHGSASTYKFFTQPHLILSKMNHQKEQVMNREQSIEMGNPQQIQHSLAIPMNLFDQPDSNRPVKPQLEVNPYVNPYQDQNSSLATVFPRSKSVTRISESRQSNGFPSKEQTISHNIKASQAIKHKHNQMVDDQQRKLNQAITTERARQNNQLLRQRLQNIKNKNGNLQNTVRSQSQLKTSSIFEQNRKLSINKVKVANETIFLSQGLHNKSQQSFLAEKSYQSAKHNQSHLSEYLEGSTSMQRSQLSQFQKLQQEYLRLTDRKTVESTIPVADGLTEILKHPQSRNDHRFNNQSFNTQPLVSALRSAKKQKEPQLRQTSNMESKRVLVSKNANQKNTIIQIFHHDQLAENSKELAKNKSVKSGNCLKSKEVIKDLLSQSAQISPPIILQQQDLQNDKLTSSQVTLDNQTISHDGQQTKKNEKPQGEKSNKFSINKIQVIQKDGSGKKQLEKSKQKIQSQVDTPMTQNLNNQDDQIRDELTKYVQKVSFDRTSDNEPVKVWIQDQLLPSKGDNQRIQSQLFGNEKFDSYNFKSKQHTLANQNGVTDVKLRSASDSQQRLAELASQIKKSNFNKFDAKQNANINFTYDTQTQKTRKIDPTSMIISKMEVRKKPFQIDLQRQKRSEEIRRQRQSSQENKEKIDKGTGDQALHTTIYGLDNVGMVQFQRVHIIPKSKVSLIDAKERLWQIMSDEVSTSNQDIILMDTQMPRYDLKTPLITVSDQNPDLQEDSQVDMTYRRSKYLRVKIGKSMNEPSFNQSTGKHDSPNTSIKISDGPINGFGTMYGNLK